jgi:putative zinc finger protein
MSSSSSSVCGNKEALVAYLYGECDGPERDALDAHLLTCLTCATELRGLRSVRTTLAEWTVPDVELDVSVAPQPAAKWFWPVPVWAQAAAMALLVLSAAAAIANVEVRYGSEGVVVRTGWTHGDAVPDVRPAAAPASAAAPAEWRSELTAVADQLRREFAARTPADSGRMTPVRATASSDQETLRRVETLIEQSERRQQSEFALRIQQLARDVETNRRADLVRIEQSFGQIQGQTGAAIAQQRDYMNYLVRTSQRQR